jgi:peptidoglycan/LPS O-acetylase OafA/YrhL
MRLPLAATLIIGALLLWFASKREGSRVPAWVPTLAIAIGSLGVSVAAATQPGVGWSISSICFSLIAIILILIVLRDILKRPR